MPLPEPIAWEVGHQSILDAIQWACKKLFYSIDRPGMNPRRITEKLDDKIMGDVAAVAVLEYLASSYLQQVSIELEIRFVPILRVC